MIESVVKTLEWQDGSREDINRVLTLERIWRKYNEQEPDGETDKS